MKLEAGDEYRFYIGKRQLYQVELIINNVNEFSLGFLSDKYNPLEIEERHDQSGVYITSDFNGLKRLSLKLSAMVAALEQAFPFDYRYFIPLYELGLSSKTTDALRNHFNFRRLGDLIQLQSAELLKEFITKEQIKKIQVIFNSNGFNFGTVIKGWEQTIRKIDQDWHDQACDENYLNG